MIDIKKFKNRLYYEITNEIWIKLYCLISILIIHLIWIFSILFLNYEDLSMIYGIPYFLIIPYLLYLTIDFKKIDTIASEKINKYLNYIISVYLTIIIIIAVIPNKFKKLLPKKVFEITLEDGHEIKSLNWNLLKVGNRFVISGTVIGIDSIGVNPRIPCNVKAIVRVNDWSPARYNVNILSYDPKWILPYGITGLTLIFISIIALFWKKK